MQKICKKKNNIIKYFWERKIFSVDKLEKQQTNIFLNGRIKQFVKICMQ